MQSKCAYGLAALGLATASLLGPGMARAQTVSAPVVYGNLAVYPVEGGTVSQATPLTIGQAMERGLVKINLPVNGVVSVDNLSSQSVFIPFGTLLAGGLQDQVVSLSTIVPPNAADVHLFVFCVDPFRMTARQSESGDAFTTSGELIPSRTAALSMLVNFADSDAAWRIHQAGVWWSIDTLRSQLERTLQTTLKPATSVAWTPDLSDQNPAAKVLSLRTPAWTDSLPQALSNPELRSALVPYARAFRAVPRSRNDVTGAAFVIDGKLVGVEVYRSPELFQQMWPSLLQAYSTEAIAAPKWAGRHLPSAGTLRKLLSAARAQTGNGWTIEHSTSVHETDDMFYSEFRDADGVMIAASYLPKALPPRSLMTPDMLVVDVLEHDNLEGLTRDDRITFARDAAGAWSAMISAPANPALATALAPNSRQSPAVPFSGAVWSILAGYVCAFAFVSILLLRRRLLSLCKRSAALVSNWLSAAGSGTRRYSISMRDGIVMTSAAIRRLPRRVIAILNEPLIPSPAAVVRACRGMSRVPRTR